MTPADNLCKQLETRARNQGLQKARPDLDPNCFLNYIPERLGNCKFSKNQQTAKQHVKLPSMQGVNQQQYLLLKENFLSTEVDPTHVTYSACWDS